LFVFLLLARYVEEYYKISVKSMNIDYRPTDLTAHSRSLENFKSPLCKASSDPLCVLVLGWGFRERGIEHRISGS